MSAEGVATIMVSAAALTLSLVTAVTAWVHQHSETQQSLRQQLTDVMNQLVDADSRQIDAQAKAAHEVQAARAAQGQLAMSESDAFQAATQSFELKAKYSELNQLRFVLVGQAAFLMKGIESQVTGVECNTVAVTFARLGNAPMADEYFRLSIKKARSVPHDRFTQSVACRGYAAFLFAQNDPQRGREQFHEARTLLHGNDDYLLAASVLLLRAWAQCEALVGSLNMAEQRSAEAADAFQRIKSPMFKELAGSDAASGTPSPTLTASSVADPYVPPVLGGSRSQVK